MVLNCVHTVFERCTASSIREGEAWEERKAGGIQEESSGVVAARLILGSTSILTLIAQISDFSSSPGQSIAMDQSKNCCAGLSLVQPQTHICEMPPWVCGSSPQTPASSFSPPTPSHPIPHCAASGAATPKPPQGDTGTDPWHSPLKKKASPRIWATASKCVLHLLGTSCLSLWRDAQVSSVQAGSEGLCPPNASYPTD